METFAIHFRSLALAEDYSAMRDGGTWQGLPGQRFSELSRCLVHTGVRDKRGSLSSIYSSQGMRRLFGAVTVGQWRHNQPT